MIQNILSTISNQLDEFLRNELNLSEEMVVVSSIVDVKGNVSMQIENKICIFVQNIEEEKLIKNGGFQTRAGMPPPMYINLYLVIAANFPDPNYAESLRFISLIIEFFQGKNIFDRSNTPMMSSNIEKISLEFINLDFQELNNLWSLIGAKYIPSVVYKLKMLTFNQSMIREDVPNIIYPNDNILKETSELQDRITSDKNE